jgi:hypothetical protein
MKDKTVTTTMRDPKRWAVFSWFCDNGYAAPVESEISDLLERIENAKK